MIHSPGIDVNADDFAEVRRSFVRTEDVLRRMELEGAQKIAHRLLEERDRTMREYDGMLKRMEINAVEHYSMEMILRTALAEQCLKGKGEALVQKSNELTGSSQQLEWRGGGSTRCTLADAVEAQRTDWVNLRSNYK